MASWKENNTLNKFRESEDTYKLERIKAEMDNIRAALGRLSNKYFQHKYLAKRLNTLEKEKRAIEAATEGKTVLTKAKLTLLIKRLTGWQPEHTVNAHRSNIRGYKETAGDFEVTYDKGDTYMTIYVKSKVSNEALEELATKLENEGLEIFLKETEGPGSKFLKVSIYKH